MKALAWNDLAQVVGGLPKDRAPHIVGTEARSLSDLKAEYDFLLLSSDGQWVTAALVKKGEDPVFIETPHGRVLHAPVIDLNLRGEEAAFFAIVPDVVARGAHPYNFGHRFFFPEPENGVPVPAGLAYRDEAGGEFDVSGCVITGVIIKETATSGGKICARTNLTNLREQLQPDGSIVIDEKRYWLYGLFRKDVNRFAPNCVDAFFSPKKVECVLVRELAQAM